MSGLSAGETSLRIDKWLWFARLCKSRSLAQGLIEAGEVRLNGKPVAKASLTVRPGDDLLLAVGRGWRRVRVLALGSRRGPAAEARLLYTLLEEGRGDLDEEGMPWPEEGKRGAG